jgi:anti-sigma factor RsiW
MGRMGRIFHRTPRECARVGKVLQQYLDMELDAATASEVLSHLEECRDCGLEADTYQAIKDSVGRQGAPDSAAIDRLKAFADELASGDVDPDDERGTDPDAR